MPNGRLLPNRKVTCPTIKCLKQGDDEIMLVRYEFHARVTVSNYTRPDQTASAWAYLPALPSGKLDDSAGIHFPSSLRRFYCPYYGGAGITLRGFDLHQLRQHSPNKSNSTRIWGSIKRAVIEAWNLKIHRLALISGLRRKTLASPLNIGGGK